VSVTFFTALRDPLLVRPAIDLSITQLISSGQVDRRGVLKVLQYLRPAANGPPVCARPMKVGMKEPLHDIPVAALNRGDRVGYLVHISTIAPVDRLT